MGKQHDTKDSAPRIIISGGGTGGHIFPAVSIANALKALNPDTEILFVGALGRMEMEKVPAAGYKIIGLNIQGIQRGSIMKNLMFPIKLAQSVIKAIQIIKDFKPDAAVGVGGYASGPLLYAASLKGIPYLIQEQNSYAGITNKWLGKKAEKICVAFDGMEQFFPADKIIKTGNPVRKDSVDIAKKRLAALELLKLSSEKKTILITGGSLGARTLNKSIHAGLQKLIDADVQVIWQTGKTYYKTVMDELGKEHHENVVITEFLSRMDLAYAAADVIISRAGAGTIAELCIVKKPVILVPSPNVAEDHQTKNALALVHDNAALFVADRDAEAKLVDRVLELLNDKNKQVTLSKNIGALAQPNADKDIAYEVIKLIK
ncbi:undecaprenyldiphospho-muramoylpentapeptide beta-N-acetylglucosaminyltransferase [Mucilaginibacter polytrichastri]|uniref:UDP-N-acetylglucosamine--N-acetylmuramyl-(pentapeptide) pyrophosphoryl-undecaprenol N-acetylglucosamine transferase n=1 Tax=Mucilaginibacter polytrichastri TaxID=1302689 RepID=A0A1Q6A199_9SPHI|nr:undecaprenyldiphospho-muramoylpentapeptide beta-N-acetylglucosaminyltransferase [Mucilaginibacter polytrichastri]OKS87785.1 UDP-N-acetylglucosamine--N-acetylmuramyl-(pentapeptide) pyrophosphoryl-undecaprenol N-acetylglucosamine transferase [Mucilaginibacter polytrichastri]SFT26799.1 UDP-N-acetylglucosamine-N-acetylmuramylpentapeptide N-acetylglucosamine transferase [Mucilaginibacter polytrichastri]